ncbi:helix-turn-helix domain-containing protein [Limibacterium fermenti]|uniref:helix-turn-helix domain-containing protein n=1 Tax=Limibacterium fermenti TaxID=3229863 RepID=UPI003A6A1422
MDINYKQFIFAREYRGLSQSELAKNIKGLSQSNLSKFEKGLGSLSDEVILKIVDYLKFPKGFYRKRVYNIVENAHYRTKSITKKQRSDIEYSDKLIGYIIDEMSESVEFPEMRLRQINIEDGFSPTKIAQYTRKYMGLTDEPVKDICGLLEDYGIIIVEVDNEVDLFDGVSFTTDNGYYVMVINRNFSNDHKRFTIAHELGHIIIHLSPNFLISDFRDKEKEAHEFASEFLMPSDYIYNSLRYLKLASLGELKRYWLTSMSSIVKRASDLKAINRDRAKYFFIELSRRGYRKKEPIDVYIDKPSLFNQAYLLHKNELNYSDEELAESFCLPIDVIDRFMKLNTPKVKMRVISKQA